jgi:L-asparaginase II
LAEQERSGLVETRHDGAVAVVDPAGVLIAHQGEIDRPLFFRSTAKPFQAFVAQELGAELGPEQLAVAAASHDGDPVHVALVEAMLAEAGLDEDMLGCPRTWPLGREASTRAIRSGAGKRAAFHCCSGKHTAMLRAAAARGWPVTGYLEPQHPLQARIAETMAEMAGTVTPLGVDGCGAPVHRATTRQVALAYARLAVRPELAAVWSAMHAYPALMSGMDNTDAAITRETDAVAKRGAAGLIAVAVRHGYGVAVKCWDGSDLVAGVAAVATMSELGALSPVAGERLEGHLHPAVMGGGKPVGAFRPRLELHWA